MNWGNISSYSTLSEDFIQEFQDKVDWEFISKYQNLSDFIQEFKDKVNCFIFHISKIYHTIDSR